MPKAPPDRGPDPVCPPLPTCPVPPAQPHSLPCCPLLQALACCPPSLLFLACLTSVWSFHTQRKGLLLQEAFPELRPEAQALPWALSPCGGITAPAQGVSAPGVCASAQDPGCLAGAQRCWRMQVRSRDRQLRLRSHPGAHPAHCAVLPATCCPAHTLEPLAVPPISLSLPKDLE